MTTNGYVSGCNSLRVVFWRRLNAFDGAVTRSRSRHTPGSFKADLVQTQFMGRSETDLLREVEYDGSMNGNVINNSYEPQNLQFIPVRKNMFDTVEIGISEVDGTQAEFVGNKNENTVVTLCFRKRAYK